MATPGDPSPADSSSSLDVLGGSSIDAVRAEIEAILAADESVLGEVFRRTRAGETPAQIQAARRLAYPNFVYNYLRTVEALLGTELPAAPTVALGVARTFRRILKRTDLSVSARGVLQAKLAFLELAGTNEVARVAEDVEARGRTSDAEARAIPGIYVYALPHYIRFPYDVDSGRTLFKVGRSDRPVIQRFREQTRTTALPEDPVLLRIYPADSDGGVLRERQFHTLLEAADHARSSARTGGTEWFLTTITFLDAIAATLGMEVVEVNDTVVDAV